MKERLSEIFGVARSECGVVTGWVFDGLPDDI